MVDKNLFLLTCGLIIFGVLCSYSLTVYTVIIYNYSPVHFFLRSILIGLLSILVMWRTSRLKPEQIKALGMTIFVVFLILMMIMHFFPKSLVTEAGGARRWIRLPFFSLAPVEFFKIGFIYFLSWSFARKIGEKLSLKQEALKLLPYLAIFGIIVILIAILQNDFGQVVVLASILVTLFVFAGGSAKLFALLMLGGIGAMVALITTEDYRIDRILQWWGSAQTLVLDFFPSYIADQLRVANAPESYQVNHSLNAIHNGGFFGTLFGNGDFKYGFLTEVHTDFVLAGIAEENGFVAIVIIGLVFLTMLYKLLRIANRVEDKVFYLFSTGVALLFGISFIINAFGISGLLPIKGLAVPFLSYGGSSMLASSLAMGMVLCISKTAKFNKKAKQDGA